MADYVTLTCPSCGGKLHVTNDLERFACGYCGTEHIVRRSGGIVSIAPVIEAVQQVKMGVDRTASELAIARIKGDMQKLSLEIYSIQNQMQMPLPKYTNRRRFTLLSVVLILIGMLFLSMYGILNSSNLVGFTLTVSGILAYLLGWYLEHSIQSEEKLRREIIYENSAIENKKETIKKMQEELEYHMSIVSREDNVISK